MIAFPLRRAMEEVGHGHNFVGLTRQPGLAGNKKRHLRHEWRRCQRGSDLRRASHKIQPHRLQAAVPVLQPRANSLRTVRRSVDVGGRRRPETGPDVKWHPHPKVRVRECLDTAAGQTQAPKHILPSGRLRCTGSVPTHFAVTVCFQRLRHDGRRRLRGSALRRASHKADHPALLAGNRTSGIVIEPSIDVTDEPSTGDVTTV